MFIEATAIDPQRSWCLAGLNNRPSNSAHQTEIELSAIHRSLLTDRKLLFGRCAVHLRGACPVKALENRPTLRVAEFESAREGIGPEGQPAHQIGRSFHHDQLPRCPREIEAEQAAV